MQSLVFTSFQQALLSLKNLFQIDTSAYSPREKEMYRDAAIQRFEYTFELAWKMMKRVLEQEGGRSEIDDFFSKKDLFRKAQEAGLIDDAEMWFHFLEDRNITSHAYDVKKAERVFATAKAFAQEAEKLGGVFTERYGA